MTTPKEALERARTAINAIVLSTHSVSFKADLDAIDEALASIQGEDAVERVARIKSLLASFHRNSCYPEAMAGELNDAAESILATGLVPDEAAVRTSDISDQEMRDLLSCKDIGSGRAMLNRLIRAAIRSNRREA